MYDQWRFYRNSLPYMGNIYVDLDDDDTLEPQHLEFAVCRFITEVKKLDGTDFPPKTLKDIVLCLQFYLESRGYAWHLIDDIEFKSIRYTLDNLMKSHTSQGLGNFVRQAQILIFDDEELMWQKGVLGTDTPRKLVDTLLFVLGITCALRAGKEHRSLRSLGFHSQFTYHLDSDGNHYIQYKEDLGLKTNKGGLKHTKVSPKIVNIYPIANREWCPVAIFFKYDCKIPFIRKCAALYLRPLAKPKGDVWFADAPIGVNSLQSTVKWLCSEAELKGYYTNHSLRATSATRMYNANIQEQVIQEVTGHRSLAVRGYKKTSISQKRQASNALFSNGKRFHSNWVQM